jgi:hypothetical protein
MGMKRPRLRKWAKWMCTLAAGAIVTLAVFSRFYAWRYSTTGNPVDTRWTLAVFSGQAWLARVDRAPVDDAQTELGWSVWRYDDWCWGYAGEDNPYTRTGTWHAGVLYTAIARGFLAGASVLYPVALTLIPAAILWYADHRRRRPGLCGSCGYDRAGLAADAKCPECGTVPATAA